MMGNINSPPGSVRKTKPTNVGRNVLVAAPQEKSEQTLLTVKTQNSMNSPLPVAERRLDEGDSGHEKKKSCGLKQWLIYFVKVPKGVC